eukprot:15456606-Alexandrium_andersonii.AAC.1
MARSTEILWMRRAISLVVVLKPLGERRITIMRSGGHCDNMPYANDRPISLGGPRRGSLSA